MAYFVRVTYPTIGNQYITYADNNVEILGEFLDTYIFEFGDTTLLNNIYELRHGNIPPNGISADIIENLLIPSIKEPWYKQLIAGFAMQQKVVAVDPKLIRLRTMLKKI